MVRELVPFTQQERQTNSSLTPEISEYAENDDAKSELRRRLRDTSNPLERVASSLFVLGSQPSRTQGSQLREAVSLSKSSNLPSISAEATLGRNSKFYNLTAEDRERLGGIEYRALKMLLKTVLGTDIAIKAIR
ncbi:unnamed protein product [Aspergillus oryzae]|nr:unnamed protein product [Aspergillus oryzae]